MTHFLQLHFCTIAMRPRKSITALVLCVISTVVLSLVIIARYKRAVERAMRPAPSPNEKFSAAMQAPHSVQKPPTHFLGWGQQTPPLLFFASSRLKRLAVVYSVAGLSCAFLFTIALLRGAQGRSMAAGLIFFAVFSWPVLLCWNQVAGGNFRTKRRNELIYAGVVLALSLGSYLLHPVKNGAQMAMALLLVDVFAMILVLVLSLPAVRSTGPPILLLTALPSIGVFAVPHFVASHEEAVLLFSKWTRHLGMSVDASVVACCLVSLLIFVPVGWMVVRVAVRRYRRGRTSDQAMQVDSIWLLFSLMLAVIICTPTATSSGRGVALALLAFPAYCAVRIMGFRYLRTRDSGAISGISLLYLRRFALRGRTERLFRTVTQSWRLVGDVRLIGGPDLVRSTIQPHSMLNVLRRKLNQSFIDSNEALKRQLAALPTQADPDTRFRVTDFFCSDHMWRPAVDHLMKLSHVILADFRGFERTNNEGALYEIQQMLHLVDIERVLILADTVEAKGYLSDAVAAFWQELPSTSPNYPARRELPRVILQVAYDSNVFGVLEVLFSLPARKLSDIGSSQAVGEPSYFPT